jgi:trans-2,3-dihydro-3-hydroxyanthranilate isomerase
MRYEVVDVFTQVPLEGNPVAVFSDAGGIGAVTMQQIARELNLPETVFVVPSERQDCVARLRIFTPRKEMDFAGHPTLGTAHILVRDGVAEPGAGSFCVQENVGAVTILIDPNDRSLLWIRTPPIHDGPTITRAEAAALMGLDVHELANAIPQVLTAGNPTLFVAVKSTTSVDAAALDSALWSVVKTCYPQPMCAFIFAPTANGAYSRMFAPDYGIPEDPATGSSTGPLVRYMMRSGLTTAQSGTRLVSEQGTRMGRRSILHARIEGDAIDIGGFVTPIITGEMRI